MKDLSLRLLQEAQLFWAHYLIPECFCSGSTTLPYYEENISLSNLEQLKVLQEINYNKLSDCYCGSHVKHIFAFCTWFFECWSVSASAYPDYIILRLC